MRSLIYTNYNYSGKHIIFRVSATKKLHARDRYIGNAALHAPILCGVLPISTVGNDIRRFNRKFLQALVNIKQTVGEALIVITYNTWLII